MQNKYFSSFHLFLLLTIIGGVIINLPYHNFQISISQGDHGRDLYAAQAVLRGELPYRDFWWVYGPLMPYYYGLFFKLLGIQIPSILFGKILLNIAAGLFIYLSFARLNYALPGLVAALWYMLFHQDFFFTYNHAGGIALLMAIVWLLISFYKNPLPKYAWGALGLVFILGLVKINFCLTALVMSLLVFVVVPNHQKKLLIPTGILLLPFALFLIYWFLMQGLTIEEIRQCLPYLGSDEPYNKLGPIQTLPILYELILTNIRTYWGHLVLAIIIIGSIISSLITLALKKADPIKRKELFFVGVFLMIFYCLNLHEFIKSGVSYRVLWSQPMSTMFAFLVIAFALSHWIPKARWCLWAILLGILSFSVFKNYQDINAYKTPQHYLGSAKGRVYSTNERPWLQTVVLTTKQLNESFTKDELFLALPYDCLYYYLTDKKSPTRQLIFFEHIKIPAEQEQRIILELQKNNIAGVMVSSRQSSPEQGLGTMGVNYCPLITQYLNTNFVPLAKFGNWEYVPGWNWNHGTLILKRKSNE